MVKLRRVTEANIATSDLSKRCRETVKAELGVLPFPLGEDAIVLKAAYFCFELGHMEISFSEDVILDITDSDITVSINRSCSPDGGFVKAFVEEITPQNPFAKALVSACRKIAEEVQKVGSSWCRIGNYKTLVIKTPYVDRLKAYCEANPDLRIPLVATVQVNAVDERSSEYWRAVNSMKPEEVLTPSEVNSSNKKMQEFLNTFGATVRLTDNQREEKPMSDRQKKNQLNKLLTLGIGGGKGKKHTRDPRLGK